MFVETWLTNQTVAAQTALQLCYVSHAKCGGHQGWFSGWEVEGIVIGPVGVETSMGNDGTTRHSAIFVSSTYEDLKEHRQAVHNALHRLEAFVRGMEFFGSRPGRPREECLAEVRRCRAFIGIFGMRYGSIDPESGLSFTHLEFLEAQRLGIPTLVYFLDEDRHPVLPRFVDRGKSGELIGTLRAELMKRSTVGFFKWPDDLARQITQDLPILLQKLGVGVQPNVLAQLVEALPRIDWIDDDRWQFIRSKLGSLGEQGVPEPILRGAVEFLFAEDRLTSAYLIAKGSELDMRESIDLAMEIEKVLSSVVKDGLRMPSNGADD